MISGCTWEGCKQDAIVSLRDTQGKQWAYLCAIHNEIFTRANTAPTILSAWVKAQGGAKKAAARMK